MTGIQEIHQKSPRLPMSNNDVSGKLGARRHQSSEKLSCVGTKLQDRAGDFAKHV